MKKFYEEPSFELNKFSFEDILAEGYVRDSDPEGSLGGDGEDGDDVLG